MTKLKKIWASIGLTLALLIGGATAAQAYSTYTYATYIGNYTYRVYVQVDYDWWEETFQGKRDYTYLKKTMYCPPGTLCVY